MKNIILSAISLVLLASCQNMDLPSASFDLDEVAEFSGIPGDEEIDLTWKVVENSRHTGFRITWTPGDKTVETDKDTYSYTVGNLNNGENYEISIQSIYGNSLSGPNTITIKPMSERLPVKNLSAFAGDGLVKLLWENPNDKAIRHEITVMPGNIDLTVEADNSSCIVKDLQNGQEYTFTVTTVYEKGNSPSVSTTSVPGEIEPVMMTGKYLQTGEKTTLTVNEMYFLDGNITSCRWDLGDGMSAEGNEVEASYSEPGVKEITLTVTYEDGSSVEATSYVVVLGWKWRFMFGDNHPSITLGYGKVSSTVFSPDGKTAYMTIAGSEGSTKNAGYLFAADAATGELKWVFDEMTNQTYGCGPAVADDGTVILTNRDKYVYAVNPDGSRKWKFQMDAAPNMAFPAIAEDGTVYAMDNADGANLYCISSSGDLIWKRTLEGREGGVSIDREGNLYAGTTAFLYKIDPDNYSEDMWKVPAEMTVGTCMAFGNNGHIYMSQKGDKGILAVNMATGDYSSYPLSGAGDCWSPVIGTDGSIYFCDRNHFGTLFAITENLQLKWKYEIEGAVKKDIGNFITPAIGKGDILYIGTGQMTVPEKCSKVIALNGKDKSVVWEYIHSYDGRFFSASTISPDGVWFGTTVGNATYSPSWLAMEIGNELEPDSWSCRGGNWKGNNRQE